MKKVLSLLVTLSIMLGIWTGAFACPVNQSFEKGDFEGWEVDISTGLYEMTGTIEPSGLAWIDSSFDQFSLDGIQNRQPVAGDYFAILQIGLSEPDGFLNSEHHVTLSQDIYLDVGDVISGWAAFGSIEEYWPQDNAWIRIYDSNGLEVAAPWTEISEPDHYSTPWSYWEWGATNSDIYTINMGMSATGDNRLVSYAYFDALNSTSVPESQYNVILCIGLFGLMLFNKKMFH